MPPCTVFFARSIFAWIKECTVSFLTNDSPALHIDTRLEPWYASFYKSTGFIFINWLLSHHFITTKLSNTIELQLIYIIIQFS